MSTGTQTSSQAAVEAVDSRASVEAALMQFVRGKNPAILESSLQPSPHARFSILACDPIDVFHVRSACEICPIQQLANATEKFPTVGRPEGGLPFAGGWIGYFTYEAGLFTEQLTPTTRCDFPLPLAWLCLYDSAAIYDHLTRQWLAVAIDWPASIRRDHATTRDRLNSIRGRLNEAERVCEVECQSGDDASKCAIPRPNMSRAGYAAMVACAKCYIEDGDIYQVNLSQRFEVQTDESALQLYRRLRRVNPAPFAAFLPWDGAAILSASPELFLQLRDGHVVTRPIKGTRPRGNDAAGDARRRSELAASEKDRAELVMIIDLLRNDLGRVCRFGTVRVTDAGTIERHPTVFHRVATIEGDLESGQTWVDLLRAAFPGGSITGAPKIRAMQIINELEPTSRGVYCGSIGCIGLDGSMSLNIAIRTMVQVNNRVFAYAGGAIVADSDADAEYEEIQAKASGMFQALTGSPTGRSTVLQEATVP